MTVRIRPRPSAELLIRPGVWRDITGDAAAKEVMHRTMAGMDRRYRELGFPAPAASTKLDEWINLHEVAASPRGALCCAWSPGDGAPPPDGDHLFIGATFKKPAVADGALDDLMIQMLGINPAIYRRPKLSRIQEIFGIMCNKLVDLSLAGHTGKAARGDSAIVSTLRPKTMTWKPSWHLHECVLTDANCEMVEARDRGRLTFWRIKITKS